MKNTRSTSPQSSTSSGSGSSGANDDDLEREEMLKALASRTLAQFEIDGLSSEDEDNEDEDGCADEEEWEGIPSAQEEEDEDYSVAGSDEDFDGPEDLLLQETQTPSLQETAQKSEKEPTVIVFNDPSRASANDSGPSQLERNSFMASTLRKQNRTETESSNSNGKRKREDDEEAKLAQLDRSLSNLVSHLSGPKKTQTIGLDAILSSTLPPLTREKNPQRHPRTIKTGMARAALARSLAADQEALVSGTVRASNAKTTSKRQLRALDGSADRDRRLRKAQTDRIPIGKSGGGGLIKLSTRDIKSTTSRANPRTGKNTKGRR
ncbi:hypothetical protein PGT21_013964 [Puccinia graminis f. sp. tritici]|uniref:Uncharacterized protein n=1 Tax=Puccinia graminis f. sp. tritici TaxID=56615 RepID=A0A5B0QAJ2_PUCGR|nr:hypothetical protein PGT21_013964 [Puccinia graminis f. sp. tritici]